MARNDSGGMGWFCLFEYNILKKNDLWAPLLEQQKADTNIYAQ